MELRDVRLWTLLGGIVALVRSAAWLGEYTLPAGAMLLGDAVLGVAAFAWLALAWFYYQGVTTVFNRRATVTPASLWTFFTLTRPLECAWRLATAWCRVAPDALILGEVRCGTTTLATHLSRLPGAHTPFCPWHLPFADDKESFYFVGHFFGITHPAAYRAVFPTVFEKWWCLYVRGEPFFTYDACAQYLTAPWVASQLKLVCPEARLYACVREPSAQNLSWWRFENHSVDWGASVGLDLGEGKSLEPRGAGYPPRSFRDAVERSDTAFIAELYDRAEGLGEDEKGKPRPIWRIPSWAATWPGGQLSALGRNGRYIHNLRRYARFFRRSQICVVELTEQHKTKEALAEHLAPLLGDEWRARALEVELDGSLQRNAGREIREDLEPAEKDVAWAKERYQEANRELYNFLGRRYNHWS